MSGKRKRQPGPNAGEMWYCINDDGTADITCNCGGKYTLSYADRVAPAITEATIDHEGIADTCLLPLLALEVVH